MVRCAQCGRGDCPGCAPPRPVSPQSLAIAWEGQAGGVGQRLWQTALATSTDPRRAFGELPEGRVLPALGFALSAELLAIGSFAIAGALGLFALAPELALRIVSSPVVLGALGATVLGASAALVLLHVAWGFCLELGARGAPGPARFRQGVRFGLYACGWDLLTSPAGIAHGLVARGPIRAWGPILEAVRVPGAALRAYLEQHRGLDAAARRRGIRWSFLIVGGGALSIAAAILLGCVQLAAELGWMLG